MPGIDGIETTQRIRELGKEDSHYIDVPIVALTANAVSGMKEMFFANGFNDFISKPIDITVLGSVLENFIPKEKRKSYIDKRDSSMTIKSTLKIPGLDVDKGILRTGGTIEYYYETLTTFYTDGLNRANEISDNLDSGNLSLYIINVHAMKSAAANIGGGELSEAAYTLEMAALRDDVEFVNEHTEGFLKMLKNLLESIKKAIEEYISEKYSMQSHINPIEFKALLTLLKSAIENFDIDKVNMNINKLMHSRLSEENMHIVREISTHILVVEYDEAVELINKLISEK